jgi:hypothetical protein
LDCIAFLSFSPFVLLLEASHLQMGYIAYRLIAIGRLAAIAIASSIVDQVIEVDRSKGKQASYHSDELPLTAIAPCILLLYLRSHPCREY